VIVSESTVIRFASALGFDGYPGPWRIFSWSCGHGPWRSRSVFSGIPHGRSGCRSMPGAHQRHQLH